MFYDLLTIPDPRPSKAHPEHRAARKAIEEEVPSFNTKDLGLKAGVLALMLGVACYPRIKSEQEALEKIEKERKRKAEVRRRERKAERKAEREREGGRRSRSCEGFRRGSGSGSGSDSFRFDEDRRMSYVDEWRRSAGWEGDGYGYIERESERERTGRSRRR